MSVAATELISGNRLVALGAIEAGCRFFAGYPITPSSEIYHTMMDELPKRGGLAVSAPDEISAACACVGASLAGHRAMTATSGPGFCLMIETIQYALMTETPLVVAVVQRLGPSTGGATQGGQGDVLLAEFCTSGGYTIPMFAPSTAADCYELTQWAFHWAETLRAPVVLLSDKEVGMTLESVDVAALRRFGTSGRRPFAGAPDRFLPYAAPCDQEAPDFAPVGGPVRVVATGSAHDGTGRLRKNTADVLNVLRRLQSKITAHATDMARVRHEPDDGADTLVVSYGATARAARQACRQARADGLRVSLLELNTLFPVPAAVFATALAGIKKVVVVEENLTGLYASVLVPYLGGRRLVRVNDVGRAIPPSRIVAALEAA